MMKIMIVCQWQGRSTTSANRAWPSDYQQNIRTLQTSQLSTWVAELSLKLPAPQPSDAVAELQTKHLIALLGPKHQQVELLHKFAKQLGLR